MARAIRMEVRGANRVANKFRTAAAQMPGRIDKPVGNWAKAEARALKATPYPPKPAGSTYRRTGQLANRWKAQKKKAGVWEVVNEAKRRGRFYAQWVVDKGKQAWMHRGRWWIAQVEMQKRTPKLRKGIIDEVTRGFD